MKQGKVDTKFKSVFFFQESVVSMLEQLPGAHQLKQYSFKYNPQFDKSSLEETQVNFGKNKSIPASYVGAINNCTEFSLLLSLCGRTPLHEISRSVIDCTVKPKSVLEFQSKIAIPTSPQALKENPHGCARAEVFNR